MTEQDHPPLEDDGIIGDLQTAAPVTRDGVIAWCCTPRSDSPSLFGCPLDWAKGGRRLDAAHADGRSRRFP